VLTAVRKILAESMRPLRRRVVLCGRRDAALTSILAAALEPGIHQVATEEMLLSVLPLFGANGNPINAASILPGMLRGFGDIDKVLSQIAPRRVLVAAGVGELNRRDANVHVVQDSFSKNPKAFVDWLAKS
jgi:hypothetical protein